MPTTTAINTSAGDSTAWHAIAADQVLRRLDSNRQSGLDTDEVSRCLENHGRNQLPKRRKRWLFMRLLMQLNNILIYILIAADSSS